MSYTPPKLENEPKIAVVIPCYNVKKHILGLINKIHACVWRIYVIDDKCPESTGKYVEDSCTDSRVVILKHSVNKGVGGAIKTGYIEALKDGAEIIVKIDGDGQMNPDLIPILIKPIVKGKADYTKGNRFFNLENIRSMPAVRIFGNASLSFMTKLSSGYWNLMDPTNGFTAIHADIIKILPLDAISDRFFFETDMLFRLNTIRAVVVDVPMDARYLDETSNLKINTIFCEFIFKHLRNFVKRIFYNYYLRDISLASIEMPAGVFLFTFGMVFGIYHWVVSAELGIATALGTIMIPSLSILMGLQLILAFLAYDIRSIPTQPIHQSMK